jgi:methylenetetrahydrofolate reductase (NADPH)
LVAEFVEAGILDFLALRGDFPEGTSNLPPGSLSTAADLVEVIADVRGQGGITAVAAFPNGHPESGSDRSDIKALLAKQDAGADFAITQLFFEANDYVSFVELARSAGVEIPILPGIMPIISPKRLARVLELTGERNPTELEARLLNAQDSDARIEAGIDFASKLVTDLVEAGAPGIHLYAFNEHDRVTEVLRRADLVS